MIKGCLKRFGLWPVAGYRAERAGKNQVAGPMGVPV